MTPLLAVNNLHFSWPYCEAAVLNGINLELYDGETLGLRGRNGSGKTTLFRCITGLLKPNSGEIFLHGKSMKTEADFVALRRQIGFCLQNAEDQLIFPTVMEDICFGPLNLGQSQMDAQSSAREAMGLLGIANFENRPTTELSGGELRLVALAGVLAMRPKAILLDEPLTGLDENACRHVAGIIANLDCAKIVISHETEFLEGISSRIVILKNGQLEN